MGNLIVRRLLQEGAQVRVIDVWEDTERPHEAEFVLGSILDKDAVKRAMQGIDVVHHTAALVPLTKSGDLFQQVNVEGTRIVAEAAVVAGAQSFVHLSSSAIFGKPACPVTDSARTASDRAGQAREAHTPNGRSASPAQTTPATGSTHRNDPVWPKWPNVAGELVVPVQWGCL